MKKAESGQEEVRSDTKIVVNENSLFDRYPRDETMGSDEEEFDYEYDHQWKETRVAMAKEQLRSQGIPRDGVLRAWVLESRDFHCLEISTCFSFTICH